MIATHRLARCARSRQGGAVLVVALVLLVALTLLGVSTMNSTQLGEKMATNSQRMNHAFHAAETALTQAFNNNAAWAGAFGDGFDQDRAVFVDQTDGAAYSAEFLSWSQPPVGSLYSSTTFQAGHFNFRTEGSTSDEGVTAIINGGGYQIAPKQ